MNNEVIKERVENNLKTLYKIEEIVNYAIRNGFDLYRVVAMRVLGTTYDDDDARRLIKKFMIPGSYKSKSFLSDEKLAEIEPKLKECFPFILDCDIYSDDIDEQTATDGTIEALYTMLPMYKFKTWDEFNRKLRDANNE